MNTKQKTGVRSKRKTKKPTQPSQPLTLPLQDLRKLQHALRPLMPRRIPPRRKGSPRSSNSAIDVCFAGDLHSIGHERVVDRAVDGQSVAGGRGDVFAVDEEVGLDWGRHSSLDFWVQVLLDVSWDLKLVGPLAVERREFVFFFWLLLLLSRKILR